MLPLNVPRQPGGTTVYTEKVQGVCNNRLSFVPFCHRHQPSVFNTSLFLSFHNTGPYTTSSSCLFTTLVNISQAPSIFSPHWSVNHKSSLVFSPHWSVDHKPLLSFHPTEDHKHLCSLEIVSFAVTLKNQKNKKQKNKKQKQESTSELKCLGNHG